MKRFFLTTLILFFALTSVHAGGTSLKAIITSTDGNTEELDVFISENWDTDGYLSAGFSDDASHIYFLNTNGVTIAYPVDYIASIAFEKYTFEGNNQATPYSTDFDVAFSDDDETAYTSVTEKITATETATNDYGDFVENFEDDDESKGTVTITWSGSTANVAFSPSSLSGTAAVVASGTAADVVIYASKKLDFVLKGSSSDGSLTLYSAKKCKMTLDGVTLTNSDGAAINMPKKTVGAVAYGGKTCYVDLKGTSTLVDGTTYSSAISGEDMKATLFSEGQFIFSGTGTLNVTSRYGHGIASDDYIRIRGGKHNPVININSVKDGISTNDYLLMYGGTVTVTAADDGLDVEKGYVAINGGRLTVNATDEGIMASYQGENDGTIDASINPSITVAGGLVTVTTTGDKGHALRARRDITVSGGIVRATVNGAGSKAINADGKVNVTGGKITSMVNGLPIYDDEEADLSSAAAIRSKGVLTVSGNAVVALKATADGGKGINSTGSVTLSGTPSVTIVTLGSKYTSGSNTSRARGLTADAGLTLNGTPTLRVRSLDDALYTPATLTVSGGTLQAFSTDATSLRYTTLQHTAGWLAYN
ncbi:MAG: carbohydrate-binding domain-containing protein [Bacteroidaceae bacterium]|nr:carbohydrate-binding domain-containing protein [Bacteroidaceae bacterium]